MKQKTNVNAVLALLLYYNSKHHQQQPRGTLSFAQANLLITQNLFLNHPGKRRN